MATKRDWFPDLIADWYDEFESFQHDPRVVEWKRTSPDEVEAFSNQLCWENPHTTAQKIDEWVRDKTSSFTREERLYRALQSANQALAVIGVAEPGWHGGSGWHELRDCWGTRGNLLRDANGILLPTRRVRFRWATPPRQWKEYAMRWNFRQFIRWRSTSSDITEIDVSVIDTTSVPIEDLETRLTVGVVPLVESTNDLEWIEMNPLFGSRRYRVNIKDPAAIEAAAANAIKTAGENSCDIVVMPELCLTPAIQDTVGAATHAINAKTGYPWLVVAGTAHTLIPGTKDQFHNRARAFNGHGEEILSYNKLHPYQMTTREQTRYALSDALGKVPRMEDIIVSPRRFGVIESPVGRVGVLICEDLSNEPLIMRLIDDLDLNWLIVPVMDGCQTLDRWTATYASRYAERHASVVVATTTSLYREHLLVLDQDPAGRPDPIGIGLVARRGQGPRPAVKIIPVASSHADLCTITYTTP